MKRLLSILCLTAATGAVSLAEDFVLTDSTVLPSAEVIRSGIDFVQVRYDGGMRKVKAELLPPELQERFEMRPEDVKARRDAIKRAEDERRARQQEKEDQIRRSLQDAGLHPRYMTGADVLGLSGPLLSLDARVAEYLASLWNKREAERLGLDNEAERFAASVKTSQPFYEDARKDYLERERTEKAFRAKIESLERQLDDAKAENKRLQQQVADLRKQVEKAENNSGNTTVVVPPSRPSIVVPPYYYGPSIGPAPIVRPRTIVRPKPAVRSRSGGSSGLRTKGELPASNNPSNNPHTIRD